MTRRHSWLLEFAFLFCSAEFRANYREQVYIDVRKGRPLAEAAADVLLIGFAMHAEGVLRGLRSALRALLRSSLYTAIAVAAVATVVGANLAVASTVDAVLLRQLPLPNADRLVFVYARSARHPAPSRFDLPTMRALQRRSHSFTYLGIQMSSNMTLQARSGARLLPGLNVGGDYFEALGIHPEIGRFVNDADAGKHVVVISRRLWTERFGGNRNVVGIPVQIDGVRYTIVGVAPGFEDPQPDSVEATDLWVPIDPKSAFSTAGARNYFGVGLLARDGSVSAAAADARRIVAQSDMFKFYLPSRLQVAVQPALATMTAPIARLLWFLYGAVTIVLLIGCANSANLGLLRFAGRNRERVLRLALGASRWRIVMQLVTESALVAILGTLLGLAFAWIALHVFAPSGTTYVPRWDSVGIDRRMLLYAAALVVVTTLISGLIPALGYGRDVASALKATKAVSGRSRLRSYLVVAEIALALAVVAAGGLLVRGFTLLTGAEIGFPVSNLYVVPLSVRFGELGTVDKGAAFSRRVAADLRSIHGVANAGVGGGNLPFFLDIGISPIRFANETAFHDNVSLAYVSSGYFAAMRIPVKHGRSFSDDDGPHAPAVAIVNDAFERKYLPAGALGRRVEHLQVAGLGDSPALRTIVGVVGNVRINYAPAPEPAIYTPVQQLPEIEYAIVRTRGPVPRLAEQIAALSTRWLPGHEPSTIVPYASLLDNDTSGTRAAMTMLSALALVALLLALSGVYAVSSASVQARTREIAVRKAVGATDMHILREVLTYSLVHGVAGIAIGLAIAFAGTWSLRDMLYAVSPFDPLTFSSVVALLLICSVLAAVPPALRATRVDPAVALRSD